MKINKRILATFALSASLVLAATFAISRSMPHAVRTIISQKQSQIVLLDAGHGGMDSGAVSASDALEKDLNLAITLKTRSIMKLFGIDSVMTRDSDISLGYVEGKSVRTNKQNDLRGRVSIAKKYPESNFISIHMNKFEQSQYYGAQVFYNENPRAKALAESTQASFRAYLDKDNDRKIKKSPESIYIMKKVLAPAIIAECGFLSNADEAALLQQKNYQIKTSCAIAVGYLNYLFALE